tara:strand:- start:1986 stop:2162 length:177 start_codon:yes stop_codon:yes gene_type:complete
MKVKSIKPIPSASSYSGLEPEDWRALNAGKEIEIDSIPPQAEEFFKKEKSKKDKKGKK